MSTNITGSGVGGVVSKTSALRSLLVRAWRERWSDIQWSIHLKEVLPRGATGDVYDLSGLILQQALLSPVPNQLLLGYLKHALAAQTISHTALIEAIATFDFSSGGSINKRRRPYCTQSLLSIISSLFKSDILTSHGKPEECVALSTAILRLVLWLLKTTQTALALGAEHLNNQGGSGAIDGSNCRHAVRLLQSFLDNEFLLCLMYIGKLEEKDTYHKILSTSKRLNEQIKSLGNLMLQTPENEDLDSVRNKDSSNSSNSNQNFKQELTKVLNTLTSNGLDPMVRTKNHHQGSAISLSTNVVGNNFIHPTYVHSIQPILIYEALLNTTSDLNNLAHHLYAIAFMQNIGFSDLVYEILRSLLLSISQQSGLETLKIDDFILIKLPILLEKLYLLIKAGIGLSSDPTTHSSTTSNETGMHGDRSNNLVLKTPTDVYKAFDKILKNDALLDSVDYRCKCNIIDILLRVVTKSSTPLLTDTEKDDVMKRRIQARSSENRINPELLGEEIVGPSRDFELSLKAEPILDQVMTSISSDLSKADAMETNLDILCRVIKSIDLLLAASAAKGKLGQFICTLIRLNQQSQESQGESVKNSLLRASLFDITFLMLVYIAQSFGSDVVLDEAKGEFIHSWITDMMIESDVHVKSFERSQYIESSVDTLLQQLNNGELRTQVVKWQNVCSSVHMAMKDIVIAKWQKVLSGDKYDKICNTLCSRLCALPVCVIAWFASYRLAAGPAGCKSILSHAKAKPEDGKAQTQPQLNSEYDIIQQNLSEIALSFAKIAETMKQGNGSPSNSSQTVGNQQEEKPMPHREERSALMFTIINKMLIQSGLKAAPFFTSGVSELQQGFSKSLQQWELATAAYVLRGTAGGKTGIKGKEESLNSILLDLWRNKISRYGRLDIESTWKIRHLLTAGGANWMTSVLVDELLSTVYQTDLEKMTELLISIFHVDIEKCTLSLLLHVAPAFLQYPHKRDRLTDPHGNAFAQLMIGCIYSVLNAVANSRSSSMIRKKENGDQKGMAMKRSTKEDGTEMPSAKMRRLLGYQQSERPSGQIGGSGAGMNGSNSNLVTTFASTFDEYLSSGSITSSNSPLKGSSDNANKEGQMDIEMQVRQHPLSRATKSFFQLLQTVLCYGRESPSPINCPITNFAFRILEQIALKGGPGPGFYTPGSKNSTSSSSGTISGGNLERGGLAGCRSKLLYQHFDVEMILHLVKVVPELFTSLGIITRLFDVSR